MSLRFEHPEMLWLLLAVLALSAWMVFWGRRLNALSWRRWVAVTLGFIACVVGLARPQGGEFATSQMGMRGDVYIAIDVSNSMRSEDLTPSRLDFATAFTRRLLHELPGLRVAIFPFAADGYLQMPLSTDHQAATDLLVALNPSVTTNQGSDFTAALSRLFTAIAKAMEAPSYSPAPTRVLLLSDGETHSPLSNALLDRFRSRRIPIDTIGTATDGGGPIPIESRRGFGRDFLRDSDGSTVRSKLDAKTLRTIAQNTGGNYYIGRFEEVGNVARNTLRAMELGKLTTGFRVEREYYPFAFILAVLLFSLDVLWGRWGYLIRAGSTAAACAAPLLFLFPVSAHAIDDTLEHQLGTNPRTRAYRAFNAGTRAAELGQHELAAELFEESAATATDPLLRKKALYNLGNTFLRMQDPAQALATYQRAYDTHARNPDKQNALNEDISSNMVAAARMRQQQQQDSEQQKQRQGEGEGDSGGQAQDPGKAQQFKGQTFDENQKKKLFDLISSEEQQTMQRLQQGKKDSASDPGAKPW